MNARSRCSRAAALLLALLIAPGGCGAPSGNERAVRSALDVALEAVREHRPGAVVALLAPQYLDHEGRNRDDIERLIRGWFLSFSELQIAVRRVESNFPAPGVAETHLQVLAVGRRGGGLPDADAMELWLEWVEVAPGQWQVSSARWRRLRG